MWGPILKPNPNHCRQGDCVWGQNLKPDPKHCGLEDYVWSQNLNPDSKDCILGGADLLHPFFRHPGLGSGCGEADDGLQSAHCDGQGEALTVGPQLTVVL